MRKSGLTRSSCIGKVLEVPCIIDCEPSLDALSLRSDVKSSIKILSLCQRARRTQPSAPQDLQRDGTYTLPDFGVAVYGSWLVIYGVWLMVGAEGFGVWCLVFRVSGFGSRVWGLGFGVWV